jgi:hypothetical protein
MSKRSSELYHDPWLVFWMQNRLYWVCNVRLKKEEGAGSSRTKIQGVALS